MTKSEILSSDRSPVNWLLNHVNNWTKSENTGKSALATRTTAVVAGSVFALLSATYQTLAFIVKTPGTVLRYTIVIPVKIHGEWWTIGGYIFSNDGFSATGMLKHVLKTAAFIIDIGLFPVVGLISPVANIKMHEIFKLIIIEQKNNSDDMKVSQRKAPQRLPATVLKKKNIVESNKVENKKINYERSSSSVKENSASNNQGSDLQKELAKKLALRKEKSESEQIKAPLAQIPQVFKGNNKAVNNKIESDKINLNFEFKEYVVPADKALNLQNDLMTILALRKEKAESGQIKSEKEPIIQVNEKEETCKELKEASNFNSALNLPEALVIQEQITNISRRELPKPKAMKTKEDSEAILPIYNQEDLDKYLIKVDNLYYDYEPSNNPFASPINLNKDSPEKIATLIDAKKRQLPVIPKPIVSLSKTKKITSMKLPSTDSFGNQELLEEFSKEPSSIKACTEIKRSTSQLDVSVEKPLKENSQIIDSQIEKAQQEEENSEPISKIDSLELKNSRLPFKFSNKNFMKSTKNLKKISNNKAEIEDTSKVGIEDTWEAEIEASSKESEVKKTESKEELTFIERLLLRRLSMKEDEDKDVSVNFTNIEESKIETEGLLESVSVVTPVKKEPPIIRPQFQITKNDFLERKSSLKKLVIEEKIIKPIEDLDSAANTFQIKLQEAGLVILDDNGDWDIDDNEL